VVFDVISFSELKEVPPVSIAMELLQKVIQELEIWKKTVNVLKLNS